MPYIDAESRDRINAGAPPTNAGELNYAVTRLVNDYLNRTGVRYASINEVVGVLTCAQLELYRRVAAPYESGKLSTNGDVYGDR